MCEPLVPGRGAESSLCLNSFGSEKPKLGPYLFLIFS
jgi:hypothetical protein